MKNKVAVSSLQIYTLLFVIRFGTVMTVGNLFGVQVDIRECILAPIVLFVAGFIFILSYKLKNIEFNNIFKTILCIIYFACIMVYFQRFSGIFDYSLKEQGDLTPIMIYFSVFCVLSAWLGTKSISRTGIISVVISVLGILFLMYAMFLKGDKLNLIPVQYSLQNNMINSSIWLICGTELIALPELLKLTKESRKKDFVIFQFVSLATALLIVILSGNVIGEYGRISPYPIFDAVTASGLGVFKRPDFIYITITAVSLFFGAVLFIDLFADYFTEVFTKNKYRKTVCLVCVLLCFLLTFF